MDMAQNKKLTTIKPLKDISSLEKVNINGNQVSWIFWLKNKDLKEVYLSSNKIDKLKYLNGMKNLRKINADSNQIESLYDLDDLPALESIDLRDNPIDSSRSKNDCPTSSSYPKVISDYCRS